MGRNGGNDLCIHIQDTAGFSFFAAQIQHLFPKIQSIPGRACEKSFIPVIRVVIVLDEITHVDFMFPITANKTIPFCSQDFPPFRCQSSMNCKIISQQHGGAVCRVKRRIRPLSGVTRICIICFLKCFVKARTVLFLKQRTVLCFFNKNRSIRVKYITLFRKFLYLKKNAYLAYFREKYYTKRNRQACAADSFRGKGGWHNGWNYERNDNW